MVVTFGVMVTDWIFEIAPTPLSTVAVVPEKEAHRYVDSPWLMGVAPAMK